MYKQDISELHTKEGFCGAYFESMHLLTAGDMLMPLTPEERQHIYEEERARIEARAQAEADVKVEREAAQAAHLSKPANSLITTVLLLLTVIGAIWTYNAITSGRSSPSYTSSSPVTPETSISVTAETLYQDYESNQVAADQKYKDQLMSVTGTVTSISKALLVENPFIMLRGKNDLLGTQCLFSTQASSQLAALNKGDIVTVEGRCNGYLLNVLLQDCSLHTNTPVVASPSHDTSTSSDTSLEHPPLDNFDAFFAQMSQVEFKEAWLKGLDKTQLTRLRNEPYARHGYKFKDASLRAFFSTQSWYHPTTSDGSQAEAKFTQIERDNIQAVNECQHWMEHPHE